MDNRRTKDRFLNRKIGGTIFMIGFIIIVLAAYAPGVHALSPANTASVTKADTATSASVATGSLTIQNTGDVIVVGVSWSNEQDAAITSMTPSGLTITDTQSLTWTLQISTGTTVPINSGLTCGATWCSTSSIWTAVTTSTTADTITVTFPSTQHWSTIVSAMDVPGISATPTASSSNFCVGSGCASTAPALGSTLAFAANTLLVTTLSPSGNVFCGGAGSQVETVPTGYTTLPSSTVVGAYGCSGYKSAASSGVDSFAWTLGTAEPYALVAAVFGLASATTTTQNSLCIGSCTTGANSTFFKLTQTTFSFFAGQNVATGSTVDNVTMKLKSVNINANSGTLNVAVYMPATPTKPASASNLWTQVPGSPYAVTLQNGSASTNAFVHLDPGSQICASCFFAVGFQPATTASTHAIGSGVYVYENGDVGPIEYQYNVGSSTPPTTFFSSTTKTPRDFMYIHLLFTVATTTVTTTSTLSGIVSSTVTVTSTTLDESLAINGSTNYAIALLMIVGPGLLLAGGTLLISKGQAGFGGFSIAFVVGMAIGTGLGVQSGLVTGAFEALAAIAMVFMLVMTFVTMRSGG